MKKVMAATLGLLLLLGGCSSKIDKEYQNAIQKGLDAVAEDNFSKAEVLFEIALETKENDDTAKAYLDQVQLILKADDLVVQNKTENALQLLDESTQVKEGSKVISSKSEEKKEVLMAAQETIKNYTQMLTDAKALNEAENYEESNGKMEALLKEDLTPFGGIKDEAEQLRVSNDEAIKKAEMEQAEKDAQAIKDAEVEVASTEESINGITAEYVIELYQRLESYPDLVANGDTFSEPTIYEGEWVVYVSRPNGLSEGTIIINSVGDVSFYSGNGDILDSLASTTS